MKHEVLKKVRKIMIYEALKESEMVYEVYNFK